ncbi:MULTISPECIES: hypothetical protein [unclassified Clostridium]|uniref:hypothetical protein n=1 Tax=unclassified Clostridium TaxID=2614128 RepID=UPI0020796615|nr:MULTISPECIES: hypothetical protein [unclassified Clostridium]
MFIIQTNRTNKDFQSYMYEIKKQTWEEFKEYILSNEDFTSKIVNFKYDNLDIHVGNTKKENINLCRINDDFHLQVIFNDGSISEYMLVNKVGN